jgi:GNAT superfamily N-acetyltransferase
MIIKAQAAGGEVHFSDGIAWTYAGADGEAMILFPQLPEASADERLEAVIQFYRARQPTPLVGCWSLLPTQPRDLGVRLLARGFQPGWAPCWMALDLRHMREQPPLPSEVTVALLDAAPAWDVRNLPYYSSAAAPLRQRLMEMRPRQVWYFAAYLRGQPVGHSTLCLTTGALAVAGLYDIGVIPAARNQGIGKAVTRAACLHARSLGCRYALLNATGERMYTQLGFEKLGEGTTWWLDARRLARRPPSPEQVRLAEAAGRGDLAALAARGAEAADLNAPLTNGMTLLELADETGQPAARAWLLAHGARP